MFLFCKKHDLKKFTLLHERNHVRNHSIYPVRGNKIYCKLTKVVSPLCIFIARQYIYVCGAYDNIHNRMVSDVGHHKKGNHKTTSPNHTFVITPHYISQMPWNIAMYIIITITIKDTTEK